MGKSFTYDSMADAGIFVHFDIDVDPFEIGKNLIVTEEMTRILGMIKKSRIRGHILVIEGPPGVGKTEIADRLELDPDISKVVRIDTVGQAQMTSPGLVTAVYRELSNNSDGVVPREKDLKLFKVGMMINSEFTSNPKTEIIMAIDDGQRITRDTLIGLKDLWDIRNAGRVHPIGIVIFTHASGVDKIVNLEELSLRCAHVPMQGFSKEEVREYFDGAVRDYFKSDEAFDLFVKLAQKERKPKALQRKFWQVARAAMQRGFKKIDIPDLTILMDLKALAKMRGISQAKIARRAGIPKSTANAHFSGTRDNDEERAQLTTALNELSAEKEPTRKQAAS